MWLLKRTILLNGLFVGVICVCLALLPASEGCVQFTDAYALEKQFFELNTGTFFSNRVSQDYMQDLVISPDHQHLLLQYQPRNGSSDHDNRLVVKPYIDQSAHGKGTVIQRDLPSPYSLFSNSLVLERMQSKWLPDSQHIIVRWEDVAARADPNAAGIRQWMLLLGIDGHQLASYNTTISPTERYFIDSISPNGQFVVMQTEQSRTMWLKFHATENFALINEDIQVDPASCHRPWESDYRFCAYWSPQGSWVAYGSVNALYEPTLSLLNLRENRRFDFPLPSFSRFDLRKFYWSPDGRYIAALTYKLDNTHTKSQLTVVDTFGKTIATVPNMDYLHTYNEQTFLRWSSDSQAILFRQYDGVNEYTASLEVLRIQTGQVETLVTGRPVTFQWEMSGEPSLTDDDNMLVRWQGNTDADMLVVYYGIVNIRTGERQVLLTKNLLDDELVYTSMEFSPSGEVVITSDDRIVVANGDGTERREINIDARMSAQAFSPNGRWAIFETNPDKNQNATFYGFDLQTGRQMPVFLGQVYSADTFEIFDDGIGVATVQDAENHGYLYLFDLSTGLPQLLQSSSERLSLHAATKSEDGNSLAILVDSSNYRPILLIVNLDDLTSRTYDNLPYLGYTIKLTDCRP